MGIKYNCLFQASIDQFTVTRDPSDVSEQCSVTKTALDDKLIEDQENQQMPSNTNTKGQRKLYIFVLCIK